MSHFLRIMLAFFWIFGAISSALQSSQTLSSYNGSLQPPAAKSTLQPLLTHAATRAAYTLTNATSTAGRALVEAAVEVTSIAATTTAQAVPIVTDIAITTVKQGVPIISSAIAFTARQGTQVLTSMAMQAAPHVQAFAIQAREAVASRSLSSAQSVLQRGARLFECLGPGPAQPEVESDTEGWEIVDDPACDADPAGNPATADP